MKAVTILYLCLGFCCLDNGYAKSNTECAATMGVLPPEPDTDCCGQEITSSKFMDAPGTTIYQYPWTALIEYMTRNDKLKTLCGGTLISGKYVLTAAHCVTAPFTPINVVLGDYNKTNDGPDCVLGPNVTEECTLGETRIPIEKTIPHPENKLNQKSKANDIALIRLKDTAPYTDFIRPICLPNEDFTLKTDQINYIMAGWGTSYGPSSVKLQVDLPFVTKDKCQTAFSAAIPNLVAEQFCAGGVKGKDSCKGDGGMPLIYNDGRKYVVVGLVSFGLSHCGTEGIPSVYTNVFQYSSWIKSNMTP